MQERGEKEAFESGEAEEERDEDKLFGGVKGKKSQKANESLKIYCTLHDSNHE